VHADPETLQTGTMSCHSQITYIIGCIRLTRLPGHQVIRSSGHQVISSSGHQVIRSWCHQVIIIRSSCHQLISSSCHQAITSSHHHVIAYQNDTTTIKSKIYQGDLKYERSGRFLRFGASSSSSSPRIVCRSSGHQVIRSSSHRVIESSRQ